MNLKSEADLKVALATSYAGLAEARKQEILATIQATRPGKLDELHAICTLPPPQGLTRPERAFYDAIVDLSGEEPELKVGLTAEELTAMEAPLDAVPAADTAAPALNGKPSRPFTPGKPPKEPTTNGNN